jgi:hypothetical protein
MSLSFSVLRDLRQLGQKLRIGVTYLIAWNEGCHGNPKQYDLRSTHADKVEKRTRKEEAFFTKRLPSNLYYSTALTLKKGSLGST